MQDLKAHLEKLRADAAECALIQPLPPFRKSECYSSGLANDLDLSGRADDRPGAQVATGPAITCFAT